MTSPELKVPALTFDQLTEQYRISVFGSRLTAQQAIDEIAKVQDRLDKIGGQNALFFSKAISAKVARCRPGINSHRGASSSRLPSGLA